MTKESACSGRQRAGEIDRKRGRKREWQGERKRERETASSSQPHHTQLWICFQIKDIARNVSFGNYNFCWYIIFHMPFFVEILLTSYFHFRQFLSTRSSHTLRNQSCLQSPMVLVWLSLCLRQSSLRLSSSLCYGLSTCALQSDWKEPSQEWPLKKSSLYGCTAVSQWER